MQGQDVADRVVAVAVDEAHCVSKCLSRALFSAGVVS